MRFLIPIVTVNHTEIIKSKNYIKVIIEILSLNLIEIILI